MADDNKLQVTFGAQTSELTAAFAGLRAQTEALAAQMRGLASTMSASTTASAAQLTSALSGAKASATGLAEGVKKVTASVHEGGVGLGFYVREMHALVDEFGSGRIRQGEGTLANLAMTFLQSNRALIPFAAAAAAAAAAIGVIGYKAYQAEAAVSNLRLDAAVNGFQMAESAAARLRDSIENLAGVGASDAEQIAKPFLVMGQTGATIAEMLAPIVKQLAQEMGTDVGKAAETLSEKFRDLDGAGLAYVNSSRVLTDAEKQHIAQLVASGQRTQAMVAIIDLMSRSLQTLKHDTDSAAAAARDHTQAVLLSASAGYSMQDSERMVGRASEQAAQKIDAESASLAALRAKLLDASTAADNFSAGMAAALKADKVASGIKDTEAEIARLQAGLAAAPDHASAAAREMGRALDIERQKLKDLNNQSSDPIIGDNRGQLAQFEAGQQLKAAQSRQTQQQILRDQIAANQAELSDSRLTEKEKQQLILETAQKQRQLFDQQSSAGTKAAKDVLGAARQSIQEEIQLAEEGAQKKAKAYDDDLARHRVSVSGYLIEVKASLNDEIAAVQAAYAKELQLAGLTETQKTTLRREEALTVAKIQDQIVAEERRAADASLKSWQSFQSEFNNAFTSQINGLLRGTTSWQQAFRNVLATLTQDVVKFFADWGLKALENTALQLAANNQMTSGIIASLGLQQAAQAASSSTGIATTMANAIKAITIDAGQTFAGVTAFLAPVMGPAAVGPAAAAQAAVMGVASFDIGAWSVPHDQLALIHQNELVMPAQQAGAFRSMLSAGGEGGGNSTNNHTWNITSNAADARDVANQVANLWNRNPSMRPTY